MALSQAAFNQLVDDHGAALYRVAFRLMGDRHEAEDMVQEAFRSAWNSRSRFEEGRGDRAWLVSILRRRIIDHWRKKKLHTTTAGDDLHEPEVAAVDPLANELSDEMQKALGQLPKELKETLLLVVVGELTHQEVADMSGIPLGTVLSRVSRARKRLREYLLVLAEAAD